jgi:hypothetical protein
MAQRIHLALKMSSSKRLMPGGREEPHAHSLINKANPEQLILNKTYPTKVVINSRLLDMQGYKGLI